MNRDNNGRFTQKTDDEIVVINKQLIARVLTYLTVLIVMLPWIIYIYKGGILTKVVENFSDTVSTNFHRPPPSYPTYYSPSNAGGGGGGSAQHHCYGQHGNYIYENEKNMSGAKISASNEKIYSSPPPKNININNYENVNDGRGGGGGGGGNKIYEDDLG